MHDAATSMPPQAPSTWADYLAGYRWRGQGEGCSAATVHRLEVARRPTLFVKQEVLSAHAELPAEIARLRWLHGAGIDCPQVLNETQSDGRQWLLMSAVPGDTLSALAQRGELEPERLVRLVAAALRRLHDLDPAACPFDHRLERRLDTVRQRVEAGLVDEADFDDDHRGRSATGCTACCSTGVRRSKTWWSPMATPACQICWRRGGASAASSIAGGSASPTGTRTWPWPRGTSRPNSARPGPRPSSSNTAAISTANGWRTSGYWTSSSRVGPVRVRTGFGLPLHENEVQRHRPLSPTPPRALARSAESPVQFSRYCASSFAESTRIRLGSVLCMACTKVLGISISRK
ncbi:hypothetical protein PALA56_00825 [Pseudomonas aeruginosa]|nr:hypothetical protein PALA56_00825 [Pseudomonas aeruginosa]